MTELTQRNKQRLRYLESQIRKGAQDVYQSLKAIHTERLYLEKHDTFEGYCRDVWNMSSRHVQRIMRHGDILNTVDRLGLADEDAEEPEISVVPKGNGKSTRPIGPILTESHTREVADLPDEKAAEVLVKAAETAPKDKAGKPKVTAKHVRATREEVVVEKPAKSASASDQANQTRKLAQAYIDKAIRAVCDLHEFSPNRGERDRIVKALQHIGGQLW